MYSASQYGWEIRLKYVSNRILCSEYKYVLYIWWVNNHYQLPLVIVRARVIPQQAEVAQGVPDRLSPRIFLTFRTTRVIGRQPYARAAFTPGETPWYSFSGADSTPGHIVLLVATEKNP